MYIFVGFCVSRHYIIFLIIFGCTFFACLNETGQGLESQTSLVLVRKLRAFRWRAVDTGGGWMYYCSFEGREVYSWP